MKELLFHSLEQAGVSAYGVERIRIAAAQMVEDNITPAQVIVAGERGRYWSIKRTGNSVQIQAQRN